MAETITLEFLAAQQRRILDEMVSMRGEMGSIRDDIKVLTTIVLRHEETLIRILEQIRRWLPRTHESSTAYALSKDV